MMAAAVALAVAVLAVVAALDVGIVGQRPVQIGLDRRIRVAGHPAEELNPCLCQGVLGAGA